MLSVPLVLFRGGDKIRFSKAPAKLDWVGQLVVGLGAHFTALGELQRLSMETSVSEIKGSKQVKLMEHSEERPASSPCPSSSSSNDSSSSASSPSSSSDSSDNLNNSSDSEEESPPPPENFGNGGGGNGGDDQKKKKDDEDDGNSSDSSSSDSSADESDQEEDDGVMIDTDDEKDKMNNGVDPTDEDLSDDSDGSSDLENSYPRLPSAPVDTLIAFRQQAAQKELQLTEKLKKEVIEDAKQRLRDRQQSQRSKKKKTPQSKRRPSKQSDGMSNGSTHLERHHANGSTGTADVEDEWLVDCSCGLKEKNYDDGTSMIQCDSCSHWVHAKCADKQPEAVAQEKFMCFQCSWMFDCVCDVRQRPNHDDGQRMVECESCKTWQHTMCVGIPMTEEPADDYQCPRCVRKARRRKSASSGSRSRDDRQRKRRHSEQSLHRRKSKDSYPVVAVDVRSAARSIENLTTPTRAHRSRRTEPKESPKIERKAPLSHTPSPPPVPAVSPPSSPPPPPSTPPPPARVSGSSRHDRSHSRSKRKSERSSTSSSSSNRKRGRSLGSSPSSSKKEHSVDREEHDAPSPSAGVKPSPRGKGLMLRGYSPAARSETPSSRSVDVRPPLPLTPRSGSDHSYSSHNSGGRKRKTSSARDRLAKKLKIKKSSLR
ncbi:Nucleosome-remodeling factor subunit [Phytophthora citrophthora]|uniref:Nucleosome-remodeling factor subunit n=1 Tax=Phytophthora citrophthora TaxID=4793 RepID=A0AAD9FZI7_9STRA|nr:Nucleosome-remodeling factor subunit [Phytophthora citrophthora]